MSDKRISELPLGASGELNNSAYAPFDVGVSVPGTGATKKFRMGQLSEALLAAGALADFLNYIKTASAIFRGYYSTTQPNDPAVQTGYLWWQGSGTPSVIFPIPMSALKQWNGTAWIPATAPYMPDAFDRWADLNDGNNYFWSPSQGQWLIDTVSGDGVTIGTNSVGKLHILDGSVGRDALASEIIAVLDNALNKTGDTMTGRLRLGYTPSDDDDAIRLRDLHEAVEQAADTYQPKAPADYRLTIVLGGTGYTAGTIIATDDPGVNALITFTDVAGAIKDVTPTANEVIGSGGTGAVIAASPRGKAGNNQGWIDLVHNDNTGREEADCHPQSAITGLAELLETIAHLTSPLPAIPLWLSSGNTIPIGRVARLDAEGKDFSYQRRERTEAYTASGGSGYAAGDVLPTRSIDPPQEVTDKLAQVTEETGGAVTGVEAYAPDGTGAAVSHTLDQPEYTIDEPGSGYVIGDKIPATLDGLPDGTIAEVIAVDGSGGITGVDFYTAGDGAARALYQSQALPTGKPSFYGLPSIEPGVYFGVLVDKDNTASYMGRFRIELDGGGEIAAYTPVETVWESDEAVPRVSAYYFSVGILNASPVLYGGQIYKTGLFDVETDITIPAVPAMDVKDVVAYLLELYQDIAIEKAGQEELDARLASAVFADPMNGLTAGYADTATPGKSSGLRIDYEQNEVQKHLPLPVATDDKDGVVSREDHTTYTGYGTRIAALEGVNFRYFFSSAVDPDLSTTDGVDALNKAYTDASGKTLPAVDGSVMVNEDTGNTFQWFAAQARWINRGQNTAPIAVNATNGTGGIDGSVMGETAEGQGYVSVLADGRMKLNDFPDLLSKTKKVYSGIQDYDPSLTIGFTVAQLLVSPSRPAGGAVQININFNANNAAIVSGSMLYGLKAAMGGDYEANCVIIIGSTNNNLFATAFSASGTQYNWNNNTAAWVRQKKTITYSTAEQTTGDTWIDGKPIYQRTYIIPQDPTSLTQPAGVSDFILPNTDVPANNTFPSSVRYNRIITPAGDAFVKNQIDTVVNTEYSLGFPDGASTSMTDAEIRAMKLYYLNNASYNNGQEATFSIEVNTGTGRMSVVFYAVTQVMCMRFRYMKGQVTIKYTKN